MEYTINTYLEHVNTWLEYYKIITKRRKKIMLYSILLIRNILFSLSIYTSVVMVN